MKKALLIGLISCGSALALPEGGQVIQGNLQINQPGAHILQILQSSPTGIINWGSFNIDANQLVQFLQPNSSAALLNRVVGQDPSQIMGQLQANGRILLVNPNGILFGPGSRVDAGSFLASTLSIQDQDFLQGRYDLHWDGTTPLRAVVNQGEIRVADGGFIALVSPLVDNQGLLLAERGQVMLGATRHATLSVDARGMLQVVIPDGFNGSQTPGQPQTVVLTEGQMSDTLAQLVSQSSGSEASRVVHTAQGYELQGGEGILVNQGTIRADAIQGAAGSVLLNSSQATVLTPESRISASSAQGNGGDIRAFSAGRIIQHGFLEANSQSGGNGGFVEVSAPRIRMTRGADVSAVQGTAGVFFLDPENINIVASGGVGPNVTIDDFPGTDIDVTASSLNVTGSVLLQAHQNINVNTNVDIDQNTQLRLDAEGNVLMAPGSSINATDPNASVTINATNGVEITDLQVPTSHIQGGAYVYFLGGTLGQPGIDTLVDVNSTRVESNVGSTINVVGQNVNLNLVSDGDILLRDGTQWNLSGSNSNHVSLASAGQTFLGAGTSLNAATPGSVDINAGDFFNMDVGSSITASTLLINATNSVEVRDLHVPTVNLNSDTTFVRIDPGTIGQAGSPTVLNISALQDIGFIANSQFNLVGTTANVTLASGGTVNFGDNSTIDFSTTQSNMAVAAADTILLQDNSVIRDTGLANYTFDSNTFASREGSGINASNPSSAVSINATGSVTLHDLQVPTSNLNAGTFVQFNNGTLGQPNSDTVVNATSGSDAVALFAGSNLDVVGQKVRVNWSSTAANVALGDGSRLNLLGQTSNNLTATSDNTLLYIGENSAINSVGPTNISLNSASSTILQRNGSAININGTGHVSINGVDVVLQEGSSINASGPGSRLDVVASGLAQLDGNEALPIVNVTTVGPLDLRGSLGRPGSATTVNTTGSLITIANLTLQGSQVDWTVNATSGDIFVLAGAHVAIQGGNNHLNWTTPQNIQFTNNTLLSADGATQLQTFTGNRTLQFTNSSIALPNAGSNININSSFSPAFSRVQSGGNFVVNATAGNNVRIADQVEANNVTISSPGQLIDDRTDDVPAIVAHNALNVTVANITGPINAPDLGLVQAFPFSTGSNAVVRFNLTGPNNTTLGDRSANLYYYFPQSGDVQVVNPQSQFLLYNQPAPPPPPSPAPNNNVIDSREDLTPQQFQVVTAQAAQTQVQMANLYSVSDFPSTSNLVMLEYQNAGLTGYSSSGYLTAAVVERIVLSPEAAAEERERRDQESEPVADATSMIVAGDDDDAELRFWRKLIEGIILWESD